MTAKRIVVWVLSVFALLAFGAAAAIVVLLSLGFEASDNTGRFAWPGFHYAPNEPPRVRDTINTHLYTLDMATVALEPFAAAGSAIERVGDRLLVAMPGGRLATVDRDLKVTYLEGRMPLHEAGAPTTLRVLDILVWERMDGQHDLFATHHFLVGGCMHVRLSATTLEVVADHLEVSPSWRTVFDVVPCLEPPLPANESGGRLLADGPNHLLVAVPPLSEVLRVNVATGAAETYTLGHRNPQGFARDSNNNVWLSEHDSQSGDELNLLERGGNYAWSEVSEGASQRMEHHERFVTPAFAWTSPIGLSAIIVNDVTAFPLWQDDLLIASQWGGSHGYSLFRVRHQARQVKYVEPIAIGHPISDLAHGPNGSLALVLGSSRLLLLRPSDLYCGKVPADYIHALHCAPDAVAGEDMPTARSQTPVAAKPASLSAEARDGQLLYTRHCAACHALETRQYGLGPHLVGILGQRAGTAAIASPALDTLDMVWDEDNLVRFILDPGTIAPGTTMPANNISQDEARAIVRYIAERTAALGS